MSICIRTSRIALLLLLIPLLFACGGSDDGSSAVSAPNLASATTPATQPANQQPESTPSVVVEPAAELAPELQQLDDWTNSAPLTLEGLRGRVVLIVFWSDT
jgi:hypothetical protein